MRAGDQRSLGVLNLGSPALARRSDRPGPESCLLRRWGLVRGCCCGEDVPVARPPAPELPYQHPPRTNAEAVEGDSPSELHGRIGPKCPGSNPRVNASGWGCRRKPPQKPNLDSVFGVILQAFAGSIDPQPGKDKKNREAPGQGLPGLFQLPGQLGCPRQPGAIRAFHPL